MGGGAGIVFEVKLEAVPLKWDGKKWQVTETPEIESWRAEDYMNAMGNIHPGLLKVLSFDIAETDADPDAAEHATNYHGGDVYTDPCTLEGMVFGGYMRGPWEEMFPMELTGTVHIQYYGNVQGVLTVKARNKRQFGAFYRGLFEGYGGMPESAKTDNAKMVRWYDNQYARLVDRYGA